MRRLAAPALRARGTRPSTQATSRGSRRGTATRSPMARARRSTGPRLRLRATETRYSRPMPRINIRRLGAPQIARRWSCGRASAAPHQFHDFPLDIGLGQTHDDHLRGGRAATWRRFEPCDSVPGRYWRWACASFWSLPHGPRALARHPPVQRPQRWRREAQLGRARRTRWGLVSRAFGTGMPSCPSTRSLRALSGLRSFVPLRTRRLVSAAPRLRYISR